MRGRFSAGYFFGALALRSDWMESQCLTTDKSFSARSMAPSKASSAAAFAAAKSPYGPVAPDCFGFVLVQSSVQSEACTYSDVAALFVGLVTVGLRFDGTAAGAAFGSFGFFAFFVAGREGMSDSDARSIRPISVDTRSKSIAASYFELAAESFNRPILFEVA